MVMFLSRRLFWFALLTVFQFASECKLSDKTKMAMGGWLMMFGGGGGGRRRRITKTMKYEVAVLGEYEKNNL